MKSHPRSWSRWSGVVVDVVVVVVVADWRKREVWWIAPVEQAAEVAGIEEDFAL